MSDRIRLAMALPEDYHAAVLAFSDYVKENTLAAELSLDGPEGESQEHQLAGAAVRVSVSKIAA